MRKSDRIEKKTSAANLSRRDFLKGSAAAGAAALGGGILAAGYMASPSPALAADAPQAEDGASNTAPIPPEGPPASWDKEADIVVVGLGGCGLASSLRSRLNGCSVIAIDKDVLVGGATKDSSVFACMGGTKLHAAAGTPFDPQTIRERVSAPNFSMDNAVTDTLIMKGAEFIDWMGDLGVPWEFDPVTHTGIVYKGSSAGGFVPRTTKLVVDFAYQKAVEAGVEFLLTTSAAALIKDGARIVGIKAVDNADKSTMYIKANKAVILAAGGMSANKDLLREYVPSVYNFCPAVMPSSADSGEVIRMGLGAGADLAGFDSFTAFDGGMDWGGWSYYLYSGDVQLVRQPWLGINIRGQRYTYFDERTVGTRGLFMQSQILQAQPGHRGYVFFDSDYEKNAPVFEQQFCRKLITPDMPNLDRLPAWLGPHDWRIGAKRSIERGVIKKADTIEGLAAELGFDVDTLKTAVENWNKTCAAGEDKELGFAKEWLIPLQKPPFYGAAIGAYVISTGCGVRVNTKMQVLDTKGKVIPGLYAGGMTAGGLKGSNTLGMGYGPLGDNNLSWTTGYIAAEGAMAEK